MEVSEAFEFPFSKKRSVRLTRYDRGVSCKKGEDE